MLNISVMRLRASGANLGRTLIRARCMLVAVAALALSLPLRAQLAPLAPGPSASATPNALPAQKSAQAAGKTGPVPSGSATPGAQTPRSAGKAPAAEKPTKGKLAELEKLASRLKAFARGELQPDVDPDSLFDIEIDDQEAVLLERERLQALLAAAGIDQEPPTESPDGAAPHAPSARPVAATTPTGGSPTPAAKASGAVVPKLPQLDQAVWQARLAVDEARLAIYSLAPKKRRELFATHERRQGEQPKAAQKTALSDAERRARAAEKEHEAALEAARKARSEAQRLVVEERARLLGITTEQAKFEAALLKRDEVLSERGEQLLKIERRVREMLERLRSGSAGEDEADALYVDLRQQLRSTRSELAEALARFITESSKVPVPGEDRLSDVPPEIDTKAVARIRAELNKEARKLERLEEELETRWTRHLHDETTSLNERRLELLPYLSHHKRLEVTSLSPSGLDQALGEFRQVALILQYHLGLTLHWLAAIQRPGSKREDSAMTVSLVVLKWFVPLVVFVWWRRRAERVIDSALGELEVARARTNLRPGPLERLLSYVRRIRSPLEWLLLIWVVLGLLPPSASQLLEVKLTRTIFGWTLGGSIVVHTIDFLAGQSDQQHTRRSMLYSGHLRLRSLRLAGRVVVSLGLILGLTSLLVGKGTIYGWVLNFCWFAGVLVLLVILRWWRSMIFERVDYKRKKSRIENWIVSNRTGLRSFPAAVVGACLLVSQGTIRFAKTWVSGFEMSRRVLAYLFRLEIKKKAVDQAKLVFMPLTPELHRKLGPMTASEELVQSVADEQVTDVIDRINAPGGGVFAVVGERGAGKSTLLKRIAKDAPGMRLVDCPFGGMRAFAPELLACVGGGGDELLEQVAKRLDTFDENVGVLVDNAHRLIQPAMGGLKSFDRVIEIARQHSKNTAWVFAFDAIIWQFFERMRGSRPLFDSVIRLRPWTDTGIASLITSRSEAVQVNADFSHLVGELPPDADEIDLQEALDRTETGYYRLIWDYADGNPGVALTVWHESLGIDPEGRMVVRAFSAPDAAELEGLPDSAKFVLRAVVQLERANSQRISQATGVELSEVDDALRYGNARGYFERNAAGYAVTWQWFRAITRYLARHHLLISTVRGATE